MQRDLVGRFPNVSALDATLILRSLDTMLEQIGIAIRLLSLFTLATGIAILIAASMAAWISDSRVDAASTADSSLPVAIPSALSWS